MFETIERCGEQRSELLVLQKIITYKQQRLQDISQFLSQSQLSLAYLDQIDSNLDQLAKQIN